MEGPSADKPTDRVFTVLSRMERTTEHVDPHRIVPFTSIRALHRGGMLGILGGIVKSGWDSNRAGIYVVALAENPLPKAPAVSDQGSTVPSIAPVSTSNPLFGCIDGWHRLAAIKALLTAEPDGVFDPLWPDEKGRPISADDSGRPVSADDSSWIFPDWPREVDTGRVDKVPVTILQGAIPAHELIAIALHLNNASGHVVVATTYIDILAAGKRYLEVYCEDRRQRAIQRNLYLGDPPVEKVGPSSKTAKKVFVDEMTGLQGASARIAAQDYNTVLFLNRTPGLLELLQNFEAQKPTATEYVVKRTTMKELEGYSRQAIVIFEGSTLWAMEVLILAQEEFDGSLGKKNNGPGKLAHVPLILSSLPELYALIKRVPPLLEMHEVVRAVSEICCRCSNKAEVESELRKMTQAFLERARSPPPPPPQTPPVLLHFELDQPPSGRSVPQGVSADSGPAMDPGLKEALQAMDEVGQELAVGQPSSPQPRSPAAQSGASSPSVSPRGPGIPFVSAPSAGSARNEVTSAAASASDEITPRSPPRRRAKSPVPASRPYIPRDPTVRQIEETPEARARRERRQALGRQIVATAAATGQNYSLRTREPAVPRASSAAPPLEPSRKKRRRDSRRRTAPQRIEVSQGASLPFDDDVKPLEGSARFDFMRAITSDKAEILQTVYVPMLAGSATLVEGFFAACGKPASPKSCDTDVRSWLNRGGPALFQCVRNMARLSLREIGFAIIDEAVPGTFPNGGLALRNCVDGVLNHFRNLFSGDRKCCGGQSQAVVAWSPIHNRNEKISGRAGTSSVAAASLRFQTPRDAILQHLEKFHPSVFTQKLMVDCFIAIAIEQLVFDGGESGAAYKLPATGSRILLSAPGCEDQCTHTDFPERSKNGEPPETPSFFAIVTGMQGASLKVVPQSHKLVARIEYLIDKAQGDEGSDAADALSDLAKHNNVTIPPYSLFIGRGDLVHAGTGLPATEKETNLRFHTYVVHSSDTVHDNIFIYEFDDSQVELSGSEVMEV
jgi:hypothetical protein